MLLVLISISFTFLLLCFYAGLMRAYTKWLKRLHPYAGNNTRNPCTRFSVIIPARNEQDNIGSCVLSILQNNYPSSLFEIIVVDDYSTDNTAAVVKELRSRFAVVKLVQMKDEMGDNPINAYKKKAIETAIGKASGEWVVTTDADCIVPANWLLLFDSLIQERAPEFVAGPVMFMNDRSFTGIFQVLDFISLQGITAASVSAGFHSMCNGANLAYKKSAFAEVNGFLGIDNIASGDDMLLMHKIAERYPGKIEYLFCSDAVVLTAPMPDVKSFLNQRIRWASKATAYKDRRIFYVLLLVYVLNFMLFLLPVLSVLFYAPGLLYWLALLSVKILVEFPFMLRAARFFRNQQVLGWFPLMQPVHVLYTVVAGWLGKWGSYQWKGRMVK